jgi:glycerol-3-phosphate acyltransferase PlsY
MYAEMQMVLWALFGYAMGSIPFAFLLARGAGVDVRVAGSGNVGAANVLRTSGLGRAIAVMTLDMMKGATTVLVAMSLMPGALELVAAAAVGAVVGHIYPVWLRFRGGKGVAVAAGVFSILTPLATMAAVAVFLGCVWTTRLVSLGSIAATMSLAPFAWAVGAHAQWIAAAIVCAGLILFRHRGNLTRILHGTERRLGAVS